jgi:protein-tyrosine-phosphatase
MRSASLRIVVCSLALGCGLQAPAQGLATSSSGEPARVVFVCEHGSVKSLVAMMYFNRSVEERGLPYRAVARGTAPEPVVPAAVRDGLRADGFVVSAFTPRRFDASDADHALLVVSFDQDLTKTLDSRVRYVKWDDLPGVLSDYARGRAAILRHVDELIDELARGTAP